MTADYSFLNERLAQHYGVPDVYGERFRRVTFTDGVRGGVLGQGGVLMVTSYPDRTAPVSRGFWVLDNLLGMPPPPPPPATCRTSKKPAPDGRKRSMREQMEMHRSNPACAVCHVRMDPLGFAMENFDAIGKWRHDERRAADRCLGAVPRRHADRRRHRACARSSSSHRDTTSTRSPRSC